MLLFLIAIVITAYLSFTGLPFLFLPIIAAISITYFTFVKSSLPKLVLSLTLIIFVFFSSQGLRNQVDNLAEYTQTSTILEMTLKVVERKDDYYTLQIIEYNGLKARKQDTLLFFTEQEFSLKTVFNYTGEIRQFNVYKNPGSYRSNEIYVFRNYGYITESTGQINTISQGKEKAAGVTPATYIQRRLETLSETTAPLAKGVLLGDRSNLSPELVQNFRDSGLIHITAVSGLHIGIIYVLLQLLAIRFMSKKHSIIIGLIGGFLFSSMVGFKPSTLRAVLMLSIYSLAAIKGYPYSLKRAVQVTALLNILYNPFVIFDMGFQFSYLAVFGIAYIYPNMDLLKKIPNKYLRQTLLITLAVQLVLLPLNYYYNRGIPILTPIANLLVGPVLPVYIALLLSYILVPLIIVRIPLEIISHYILNISSITGVWFHLNILHLTIIIFTIFFYITSNPQNSWPLNTPIAAKYIVVKINENKRKIQTLLVSTIIIIIALTLYLQPQVTIHFLDVGQGDSALIQYNGNNILIDTGGIMGSSIGQRVLLPTLNRLGVRKLDYLFITHPHYDHMGALSEIAGQVKIERILFPDNPEMYTSTFLNTLETIENHNIELVPIKKGDSLNLGSLQKIVIHPETSYKPSQSPANNISLVTLLEYKGVSVLFTGDIETEAENLLLGLGVFPPVDVLKVAHHGSSTSTSEEFLNIVRPKSAIISVGNNRYGHPSQEVIERLQNVKTDIYITQLDGMITIDISRTGKYKIKKFVR